MYYQALLKGWAHKCFKLASLEIIELFTVTVTVGRPGKVLCLFGDLGVPSLRPQDADAQWVREELVVLNRPPAVSCLGHQGQEDFACLGRPPR